MARSWVWEVDREWLRVELVLWKMLPLKFGRNTLGYIYVCYVSLLSLSSDPHRQPSLQQRQGPREDLRLRGLGVQINGGDRPFTSRQQPSRSYRLLYIWYYTHHRSFAVANKGTVIDAFHDVTQCIKEGTSKLLQHSPPVSRVWSARKLLFDFLCR